MNIIEKLAYYLSFPFVQYAVIVGVLISICASIIGVILVLKHFSYIGDGLSHVAFGALAIASVLSFTNNIVFILVVTILCAILLLCFNYNGKIKGDASIALIAVSSLAFGYLLMNVFPTSANVSGDVCTTLFGSTLILTLTIKEVWLCVILCIVTITVFTLLYNKIFLITFDENYAKATGTKVWVYNLILAILIGTIIVLAMKLVGSLLISALITFPAVSAMLLCKKFKSTMIVSIIFGVISSLFGILIAILIETPVGSTIVCFQVILFLVIFIISKIQKI